MAGLKGQDILHGNQFSKKDIEAIMKIENIFMQVGVFLTVFGMLILIISIFIPF